MNLRQPSTFKRWLPSCDVHDSNELLFRTRQAYISYQNNKAIHFLSLINIPNEILLYADWENSSRKRDENHSIDCFAHKKTLFIGLVDYLGQ